jgi:hypothetical protein
MIGEEVALLLTSDRSSKTKSGFVTVDFENQLFTHTEPEVAVLGLHLQLQKADHLLC